MTSSYEVLASMLLDTTEFLTHKPELARDMLARLKQAARSEAELLFREYTMFDGSLTEFSERISKAINKVKLQLEDSFSGMQPTDSQYQQFMLLTKADFFPKKLVEIAWDRVEEKLPLPYKRNMLAATLAAKFVYREGIHAAEMLHGENLSNTVIRYFIAYCEINRLRDRLVQRHDHTGCHLMEDEYRSVVEVLDKAGARAAFEIF